MKKKLAFLIAILISSFCQAQSTTSTYYLDGSFKEIKQSKKAVYLKKETKSNDTLTIETTAIKDNQIVTREIYYKSEPVGKWIVTSGYKTREIDYNFNVTYSQQACKKADSALFIQSRNFVANPFIDNDSMGYTAPVLATGEKRLNAYIQHNVQYPSLAMDAGAQGSVVALFTITETGRIGEVTVSKSVNILLDKEAMRLIRNLKFLNPPTLNGKPGKLCLAVPVSFKLEE